MLRPPPLPPVSSVLDVGCGIRPQPIVAANRYVGVDAHQPYIDRVSRDGGEFICADWEQALRRFDDLEFDLVVALDFIEHLDRKAGNRFLRAARRVGRQVCIFTPLGSFPQHYQPGEPDQWGMDGGHWQSHRSAWQPSDFPGWQITVHHGFHVVDANGRSLPQPIDAFWALTERTDP